MIYLNDGVYGNFSNIIFDHQHPVAQILTCANGIDVISSQIVLPGLVDVGDWLYFEDMGAYTRCSATRFNGFPDNHDVIYVSSESGASALLEY